MTERNDIVQKKHKWCLAAAVLVAVVVLALLLEWPVLFINGQPVYQEELQIHGQLVDRVVRSRAVMKWAGEMEAGTLHSYGQIMDLMEKENENRRHMQENGQPIYGPAVFNSIQFYKKYISDCETVIKKRIEQQASQDELLRFYEEHLQEYQHVDTICAQYRLWNHGKLEQEGTIQLDQYSIRGMTESNEELVQKLLQLHPDQKIVWDMGDGMQMQLECTRREAAEPAAYEEVAGAVLQQYVASVFEQELKNRMEESTVWTFNK